MQKLQYNLVEKRFDFGVPLEDIFYDNDIHPRLKFLFETAFNLSIYYGVSIETILKKENACLQECLDLKSRIVCDKTPNLEEFKSIGAYFWVIRHFLGLLPIPLLPKYTGNIKHPWLELSSNCKSVLKLKCVDNMLDYLLIRSLNNLPKEHILLLNVMITFIRELYKKKICKNILYLTKYYCDSIFIRPYTPGYKLSSSNMIPLLIYCLKKWPSILSKLNKGYSLNYSIFKQINTYVQPDDVNFIQYVPNVIIKHVKDVESQTDFTNQEDKCTSMDLLKENEPENINLSDISIYNEYLRPIAADSSFKKFSSFLSCDNNVHEFSQNTMESDIYEEANSKLQESVFSTSLDDEQGLKWGEIVKEIQKTVRKVENYDFEAGLYSSMIEYKSLESTFSSGSVVTSYTSFSTSLQESDVIRSPIDEKTNAQTSMYLSFYSSDEELYNFKKRGSTEEDTVSNFSLKNIILNFKFFKNISPAVKRSTRFFDGFKSQYVKYKRFKS